MRGQALPLRETAHVQWMRCSPAHTPPRHPCPPSFARSGIRHGVDMERLLDASEFICRALGRRNNSRAAEALLKKRQARREAAPAAA